MSKPDGGPAFPFGLIKDDDKLTSTIPVRDGMTLRDYFAAAALEGIIKAYVEANGRCIGTEHFVINVPLHAYRIADAMLFERAK